MFSRIFPRQFDNAYRGYRFAIWLFIPIVIVKLGMGANSLFNTRFVATSADGIPLDNYGGGGADAVIAFFAVWGLGQMLLALFGILVLIRYRTMIPLMYLLFLTEQLARKAIFFVHPIASSGAQMTAATGLSVGTLVNYGLLAAMVIGFVLSLQSRSDARMPRASEGAQ